MAYMFLLTFKGRRRKIPFCDITSFVIVAQFFSLTVAMNLFYFAITLAPVDPPPYPPKNRKIQLALDYLPEFLLTGVILLVWIPSLESISVPFKNAYLLCIIIPWLLSLVPQVSLLFNF
jgi:hypothetical protein